MYKYIYRCIFIHTYIYRYIDIDIYLYMYVYKYIYAHIYTYIQRSLSLSLFLFTATHTHKHLHPGLAFLLPVCLPTIGGILSRQSGIKTRRGTQGVDHVLYSFSANWPMASWPIFSFKGPMACTNAGITTVSCLDPHHEFTHKILH